MAQQTFRSPRNCGRSLCVKLKFIRDGRKGDDGLQPRSLAAQPSGGSRQIQTLAHIAANQQGPARKDDDVGHDPETAGQADNEAEKTKRREMVKITNLKAMR
ncbi:MAG: hypothetical protein AB7F76_03315 [Parvibaculaceae bacterium]